MSGFFDELERQLVEVARSERPVRTRPLRARPIPARPLPALAVALAVTAIAVAATVRPGQGPAENVAGAPPHSSAAAPIAPGRLRIAGLEASDVAWKGRTCSGCYLLNGAALDGRATGSSSGRWVIGLHVGGGNLKRICVWLLSKDGTPEEGSTCSSESLLSVGGHGSREDAAVLTQGFASGGEEITLAGGT